MYMLKLSSQLRKEDGRCLPGQNTDTLHLFVTDTNEHGALLFFIIRRPLCNAKWKPTKDVLGIFYQHPLAPGHRHLGLEPHSIWFLLDFLAVLVVQLHPSFPNVLQILMIGLLHHILGLMVEVVKNVLLLGRIHQHKTPLDQILHNLLKLKL